MKKLPVFIALIAVVFAVITACSLPGLRGPVQPDESSLATSVAATEQFAQTQDAFSTLVAQATAVAQGTLSFPTATATSGEVPGTGQETKTAQPSASPSGPTPLPTLTPFPTLTSPPTLTQAPIVVRTSTPVTALTPVPTSIPAPSLRAEFVADVTVPDGLRFYPSESFTKVWRLKNTGATTWTKSYAVIFNSGDQLSAPSAVDLGRDVKTGETIDIAVKMKAPSNIGSFAGYWMLRTSGGTKFGTGGNTPFTVEIETIKRPDFGSNVVFNFVTNYCRATFLDSDGNEVYCPSLSSKAPSAVYRLFAPKIEGNRTEDEPALVMIPDDENDGFIRGIYPEFEVQNGDTFTAVIGCLEGATRCNVTMQLNARYGGAGYAVASWTEKEDNTWHSVSADLSALAGKKVQFVLRVDNNDDARDDKAFWLSPRIVRDATPNQAPVLATIGPKTVNEGALLSFTASATDADGDALTFSLGSGAPSGAAITAGGAFTWTPGEARGGTTVTVRVIVSDGSATDFEDVVVTINEVNSPPVLNPIGPKSIAEGNLLTFTATATDPDGQALTYSFGPGAPTGASITPNGGVFSWTPTADQGPNTYTVRVVVNDGSLTDFEDVVITVTETNTAPVLDPIGPQTGDELTAITFTASASDPQGQTLTYTLGPGAPAGAAINSSTGAFAWTPSEAQGGTNPTFTVRVVVSDGSLTDFEDVVITVNEVNQAPSVTSPGDQTSAEGVVINLQVAASDADLPANTLSFSAAGLPTGLSINASGRISGTIAAGAVSGSPYSVTVTVNDGTDPASVTFSWTVTS